jgi:SAM-dependent methyltransferase
LEVVWCPDSGLVQLAHSFDLNILFGESYGYRSGLNRSMVQHLEETASWLGQRIDLQPGSVVLDIGSNDGTLLRAFSAPGLQRIGIDPTGEKFREHYPAGVTLVPEFFSADAYHRNFPHQRAHIITSLGMFYDLEDPGRFVSEVAEILHPDGAWHFEQSYLPLMLDRMAYDTICHEHLEYYAFAPIERLLREHGLKVIEATLNDTNGGSIAITAAPAKSHLPVNQAGISTLRAKETAARLDQAETYTRFASKVARHRDELRGLLSELRDAGKTVFGYGASTKGNVLLQYCGLGPEELLCIAEVNEDKFGAFTPGSRIPIVSESEAHSRRPDYLLVLPWHFRDTIIARETEFLSRGGKLIFPLPQIEIVDQASARSIAPSSV